MKVNKYKKYLQKKKILWFTQLEEILMSVWVEIKVLPKPEILDVQGRTIMQTLNQNKRPVENCRYGKYIHLQIDATSKQDAKEKVKEMADFILFNPLTETYTVEVLSENQKKPHKQ